MTEQSSFLGQGIPAADNKALRQFGLMFGGIIAVLFGLILPFIFDHAWPRWPWIIAGVFAGVALILPVALSPVYWVWMRFGVIMNIIMSRLILGTVFVLTVIPAGMIFKLRRKDILDLKIDKNLASYRTVMETKDVSSLKKPY